MAAAAATAEPVPAADPAAGVLCHLIASNFAGGPEKQIVTSALYMQKLGWQVGVGSFRENRPSVGIIEAARERGLPVFLIETRSSFSPGAIGQALRTLRRLRADVLITHGYKADLVGALAAARAGAAHISVARGFTAEDWKVRLYEKIGRMLLRRFSRVLCVSGAMRDLLIAHGVRPERIEVVHNAVEAHPEVSPLNLRAEFDLPPEARVLVAAGRLSSEKGHRHLVAALGDLARQAPPICALIFGAGRERAALERQIADLGLAGRCLLAGFRRPILPALAGADLVVNPSLSEGLPNVVLEALSVRTPVVATDVGGVGELILPGETGWLVPAGEPRALSAAIADALADGQARSEMAERGHRHIAENFSFEHQARRLGEICARAMRAESTAANTLAEATRPGMEGDR
ncbi:MAG: glycosyltransferase [Candidatus Eisenbacteria bacterium]|nr:glycosyltransferase [Candidatus Eisenbacteria bacterium]